ncbi:uncharacterized protein LOC127736614 [Mytilus californianus]|uniref:uncharacterized protein LOC127736614 n=1 Tax=Mytilus californianus TaxID=6549 RepID=UPI002245F785|nr:uncharacterized protein LOC127736614 [Mytilus californianus]
MDIILLLAYKSCFFSVVALLNFEISTVHTYVTLNVQPEIVHIHQNINITCTVHGIDNINDKLTRQWSKGPDLICYNGHPIDSSKYTETLPYGNQFILHIRNVTESDVNCKYQCRYGFEAQAKSIQSSKDDLEYPPANEVRAIVHTNETDRRLTVNLHFKKKFPLPRCTALIRGSRFVFNITSSKSFGNYYEVILHHQSSDRLQCNEKVIVKCKLIHEYTIPTEDLRVCLLKENSSKKLGFILLGTFMPTTLLMIFILFLIISKLKKTSHEDDHELEITDCHQLRLSCFLTKERGSNWNSSMRSSTTSNPPDKSDQTEACLNSEKNGESESNTKSEITENFLIGTSEYQEESGDNAEWSFSKQLEGT